MEVGVCVCVGDKAPTVCQSHVKLSVTQLHSTFVCIYVCVYLHIRVCVSYLCHDTTMITGN